MENTPCWWVPLPLALVNDFKQSRKEFEAACLEGFTFATSLVDLLVCIRQRFREHEEALLNALRLQQQHSRSRQIQQLKVQLELARTRAKDLQEPLLREGPARPEAQPFEGPVLNSESQSGLCAQSLQQPQQPRELLQERLNTDERQHESRQPLKTDELQFGPRAQYEQESHKRLSADEPQSRPDVQHNQELRQPLNTDEHEQESRQRLSTDELDVQHEQESRQPLNTDEAQSRLHEQHEQESRRQLTTDEPQSRLDVQHNQELRQSLNTDEHEQESRQRLSTDEPQSSLHAQHEQESRQRLSTDEPQSRLELQREQESRQPLNTGEPQCRPLAQHEQELRQPLSTDEPQFRLDVQHEQESHKRSGADEPQSRLDVQHEQESRQLLNTDETQCTLHAQQEQESRQQLGADKPQSRRWQHKQESWQWLNTEELDVQRQEESQQQPKTHEPQLDAHESQSRLDADGEPQSQQEPLPTEAFWYWFARSSLRGGKVWHEDLALYQEPGEHIVGWIQLEKCFLAKPSLQHPGWLEVCLSGGVSYMCAGSPSEGGVVLEQVTVERLRAKVSSNEVQSSFASQSAVDAITCLVFHRLGSEACWWRLGAPTQVLGIPDDSVEALDGGSLVFVSAQKGMQLCLADEHGSGDLFVVRDPRMRHVKDANDILRPSARIVVPQRVETVMRRETERNSPAVKSCVAKLAAQGYGRNALGDSFVVQEVTMGSPRHRTFRADLHKSRECFIVRCDWLMPPHAPFWVPSLFKCRLARVGQLFWRNGLGPEPCACGPGWLMEKHAGRTLSSDEKLANKFGTLLARIHQVDRAWFDEYRPLFRALLPWVQGLGSDSPAWWFVCKWEEFARSDERRLHDWARTKFELKSKAAKRVVTCHGDFMPANIVSPTAGSADDLQAIDFEYSCVTMAIVDLAYAVLDNHKVPPCCPTLEARREFLCSYLMKMGEEEEGVDLLLQDCETFMVECDRLELQLKTLHAEGTLPALPAGGPTQAVAGPAATAAAAADTAACIAAAAGRTSEAMDAADTAAGRDGNTNGVASVAAASTAVAVASADGLANADSTGATRGTDATTADTAGDAGAATSDTTVLLGARGNRRRRARQQTAPSALELPEADFGYGGRPWQTFEGRVEAILQRLLKKYRRYGKFTVVDVWARSGFFSLQVAWTFPQSLVIATQGNESKDQEREDVRIYSKWIDELRLRNCFTDTDLWDYSTVKRLKAEAYHEDVMLLLSAFHWIDELSFRQHQYGSHMPMVWYTKQLMADILSLASLHFIELPNPGGGAQPDPQRLPHVYDTYGTVRSFLVAAIQASGLKKRVRGPIYTGSGNWADNQSTRHVFMVHDVAPEA